MTMTPEKLKRLEQLRALRGQEADGVGQNPQQVQQQAIQKINQDGQQIRGAKNKKNLMAAEDLGNELFPKSTKFSKRSFEQMPWYKQIATGMFPRATKAESAGGVVGGGILDVSSGPGRFSVASDEMGKKLSSWIEEQTGFKGLGGHFMDFMLPSHAKKEEIPKRGFMESMAETGSGDFTKDLIRDPATIPSMIPGVGAAGWISKGGKLAKMGKATSVAAGEGVVSGIAHEGDKALKGDGFSTKEVLKEGAIGSVIPGGISVVGGAAKFGNEVLGKMASQFSGVAEETLRKWGSGFGKGAKELKEIHGKQNEIGGKLLNALENFDDYLPEKAIVDEALSKMPDIKLDGITKTIQDEINKIPKNSFKGARNKLNNLLKDILDEKTLPDVNVGAGGTQSKTKTDMMGQEITGSGADIAPTSRRVKGSVIKNTTKSAKEYKTMRGFTDKLVNWNTEGADVLNSALKRIRRSMKDALNKSAKESGNPQYITATDSWHDKLNKKDAILDELGKNSKTRSKKVGQFLSTIFNKNKETRQTALADIGDIFGKDFLKETKLLQMADEIVYNQTGTAKILPNFETGKSTGSLITSMAVTMGIPIGSPKVASKVLPMAEFLSDKLDATSLREFTALLGRQKGDDK